MEAAQASAVASAAASEDLHASLEAQLRSSQADIGRLQSEVSRLKAAAASADAQALADSPASTSSRAANSQARLEQQLQSSQAEVANLRREVDQLKTAAAHASGVLPADVRQSQEASTSGQSPGQTDLQQRMQAAELERDKAKQQLSRSAFSAIQLFEQLHETSCCSITAAKRQVVLMQAFAQVLMSQMCPVALPTYLEESCVMLALSAVLLLWSAKLIDTMLCFAIHTSPVFSSSCSADFFAGETVKF